MPTETIDSPDSVASPGQAPGKSDSPLGGRNSSQKSGLLKKSTIRSRLSPQTKSPSPPLKEKWNDFFHLNKDDSLPKKEYIKMSDRSIVVDSRHASGLPLPPPAAATLASNLRSRSTIHSSQKARSIFVGSPYPNPKIPKDLSHPATHFATDHKKHNASLNTS